MKRCNKSSLFFGSIMAVFLHQIHLKIKKREMKIPLISLNKKKNDENIYKACDRQKEN